MTDAAFIPPLWVVAGPAFTLFGLAPCAVAAAWGVLALFFVIGLFGQLFDLPSWLMDVSPFQHAPQMPVAGFAPGSALVLLAVAVALHADGFASFRHRDAGY